MKALTINEVLNPEIQTITKNNSSLREYFNSIFVFLVKEFPPEDASEFLEEYEEQVIEYYKLGLSGFDAAIKLRQSYEKFLHRFDALVKQ